MQEDIGAVVLDSGERVEAAVLFAPDPVWTAPLMGLLGHKGEPWNWGNLEVLGKPAGVDARFYVLHRNGIPFSNIMTSEVDGVGVLGHVFTRPEDRRKGACDKLMGLQMEHFRAHGGKALFLGTGFESPAYRIYARHGFHGLEENSGYMEYYAATREEFEAAWFAPAATGIEPLTLAQWPILAPLCAGGFQGQVRFARLGMIERSDGDGYILRLLYDERLPVEGKTPGAFLLRSRQSGAPVGFAAVGNHPIWAELRLVDLFCHPDFWDRVGDLLAALPLPSGGHFIAYADAGWTEKERALRGAGFRQTALLARWAPKSPAKRAFIDVAVYEKQG